MIFQRSVLHPLLNGLIILLLLWLVGMFLFIRDVIEQPTGLGRDVKKVDGIVVLTGGAERLPAGLDLLTDGLAPRLMISGVDPRAAEQLIPESHPARGLLACCINIGTFAEDTVGNARETAAWARHYKMQSLVIVTSNYHIRRSMVEFKQVLPDVILVPYVISAGNLKLDEWWNYPNTASLLMGEYSKYLLALVKAGLHRIFRD